MRAGSPPRAPRPGQGRAMRMSFKACGELMQLGCFRILSKNNCFLVMNHGGNILRRVKLHSC